MLQPPIRLYFDFVDPLSYIGMVSFEAGGGRDGSAVEWVGYELCPPPSPLGGTNDDFWGPRLEAANVAATDLGLALHPPALVPWSRKAHELHLHAGEKGLGRDARARIFEAFFRDGLDIGRVDVLVEVAVSLGFDATETKAVLDVDRYQADVVAAREAARRAGVAHVPAHLLDGRPGEGFPDPTDHGTLLPRG